MRKMISFKLENLPEKQRAIVDKWADNQTNIQQSLAFLLMHIVNYTGDVDIMDFDIQRKLHLTFLNGTNEQIAPPQQVDAPAEPNNSEDNGDLSDIYKGMDWLETDKQ